MPNVLCYCHNFLKPDMQHVYRQIVSLKNWTPSVVCQKRENEVSFPFPKKRLSVLPKTPARWFRRNYFKWIKREPQKISTRRVITLLEEMGRHEADVVHVFFGHIAVQLLPFLQACPRPVIVSFHGADVGLEAEKPAFLRDLRAVFQASRLVLARSDSLMEGLRKLGCPAEKLRLQRTGIPLQDWPFQLRTPPNDGKWKFVQACRLVPKKGLMTTLAAFREIATEFPKATLTLIGDGPMRAELLAQRDKFGLSASIDMPGFLPQEKLREIVYQSHVFLHPSETPPDGNQEGVPNSLLEAMASGMACIGTRHGGIPEAIDDGKSGLLVAEKDAEGLAKAMRRILLQPEFFETLCRGARAAVMEKFEREAQTAVLEGYYNEALAKL